MEQAGRDIAVDPRQPGGGTEWRDWLWEDYTGLSLSLSLSTIVLTSNVLYIKCRLSEISNVHT